MGYKIKEFREMAGMSQKALAEKAGVARGIISQLETGKSEQTTIKTLQKIAKALNTTIDALFFKDAV